MLAEQWHQQKNFISLSEMLMDNIKIFSATFENIRKPLVLANDKTVPDSNIRWNCKSKKGKLNRKRRQKNSEAPKPKDEVNYN